MIKSYTLYELTEHLRRVISLNFPESVWITCEIAQLSYSKGHCYMDLIQKNEQDQIAVLCKAVAWERNILRLRGLYASIIDKVLSEGAEVKLKIRVDYNERYGLSLIVDDIDTAFSVGKWAIKRQETILKLKKEKYFELQSKLKIPKILQRIAIISSSTAAGWQDFYNHILLNQYQYHFDIRLHEAAMQGVNSAKEIAAQLKNMDAIEYDCVVIVRGGGAKTDLSSFDDYDLAKAIALCKIPVIVGVGHDVDESVADLIASVSLKTPTACADFIIDHNLEFEQALLYLQQIMIQQISQRIDYEQNTLTLLSNTLTMQTQNLLSQSSYQLQNIEQQLSFGVQQQLRDAQNSLSQIERLLEANDPIQILKKGYSYTLLDGKLVTDINDVKNGDSIMTVLKNGSFDSIVK